MTYILTPADVSDLRSWRARNRGSCAFTVPRMNTAYIVCSPSDGTLYLNSPQQDEGPLTVAGGLSAQAMCALLIAERLEPGFCAQLCDTGLTIEEALRDPLARAQARSRAAAAQAHAKAALIDAAAERTRRASHLDLAKLDLSDLTSTL